MVIKIPLSLLSIVGLINWLVDWLVDT